MEEIITKMFTQICNFSNSQELNFLKKISPYICISYKTQVI